MRNFAGHELWHRNCVQIKRWFKKCVDIVHGEQPSGWYEALAGLVYPFFLLPDCSEKAFHLSRCLLEKNCIFNGVCSQVGARPPCSAALWAGAQPRLPVVVPAASGGWLKGHGHGGQTRSGAFVLRCYCANRAPGMRLGADLFARPEMLGNKEVSFVKAPESD